MREAVFASPSQCMPATQARKLKLALLSSGADDGSEVDVYYFILSYRTYNATTSNKM